MPTSKQLSDIRSTATGLRSALNSAQSNAPRLLAPDETEAIDTEWADTLFVLSRLMQTLGYVLADGGVDIEAHEIAAKLERFRKQLESEHT